MKTEIRQLKSNLECTQGEMENIILENVELKKQICQLTRDLGVLKQICRSPVTSLRKNMSSSTKKAVRRRLTDSFQITPLHVKDTCVHPEVSHKETIKQQESISNQETTTVLQPETDMADTVLCHKQLQTNGDLRGKYETSSKKHNDKRVFIFGGKQCSGIALKLIKSRLYSQFVEYQFLSFVKPYASTEVILSSLRLCNDLTPEDRIIIAVGQHDTDPLKIIAELCIFLKLLFVPF